MHAQITYGKRTLQVQADAGQMHNWFYSHFIQMSFIADTRKLNMSSIYFSVL